MGIKQIQVLNPKLILDTMTHQASAEDTVTQALYDDSVLEEYLAKGNPAAALKAIQGEEGRGFLYKMSKGDSTHFLLGTMHPEDAYYKKYLQGPLRDLVARRGLKQLYVEVIISSENAKKMRSQGWCLDQSLVSDFHHLECIGLEDSVEVHITGLSKAMVAMDPTGNTTFESAMAKNLETMKHEQSLLMKFAKWMFQGSIAWDYRTGNEQKMFMSTMGGVLPPMPPAVIKNMKIMDEFNLYERTLTWLKSQDNFNGKPDSLIAVGARHLYGSKGMITLLREDGWEVTRCTGTPEEPFEWPAQRKPAVTLFQLAMAGLVLAGTAMWFLN